jgi:hypothetical protein
MMQLCSLRFVFSLWLILQARCGVDAKNSKGNLCLPLRTVASFALATNKKTRPKRLFNWNHHQDPNPDPDLDDLEESVTTEEIDLLLEEITAARGGLVLNRYLPTRRWLWQQWKDSVLSHSFPRACWSVWGSTIFCILMRFHFHRDFNLFMSTSDTQNMNKSSLILDILRAIGVIWKNLSMLTTFLLTCYVSQTYTFWRSVYDIARTIQGQMSDIHLLLATHAARRRVTGAYTANASLFLEDIASKLKAFHICLWATHTRRFRILLTEKGFSRMVARGLLTAKEKETLDMQLGLPRSQKHYVLLEWVLFQCKEASKRNIIEGEGLDHTLLERFCALRDSSAQISSKTSGRMPLPYIHFVQILLDVYLFFAPFAQ